MWRRAYQSLRFRLAVLVATVVIVTGAAAFAVARTLGVASGHVSELSSAQRRLELLSAVSGRVTDYALTALQTTQTSELQSDRLSPPRKRVQEAFERLNDEVAREYERQADEEAATLVAARSRVFAFMRARFDFLDRQTLQAIRDARGGQSDAAARVKIALDEFASGFTPALGQAIEEERAAARAATDAMADLRARLAPISIAAVTLAALIAFLLYRAIASPLLARVSRVAGAAAAIARGQTATRLPVRGHDELSLLMMRFNRMALQLSRREERLMKAQLRLQEVVNARTAELREANARLSDIDRARRRFFTDVSHELRTPLTVILGEVDISLRGQPDAGSLRGALATIRARARALHRRVEDLLRVARSESGQLELDFSPVSLAEIVQTAADSAEAGAKAARVKLHAGPFSVDPIVEADADWLRQVIEGLIANAVRHTPPDGAVRLDVHASRDGSAEILVADDGAGIPEADLPRIFERFYRGADQKEGSGFGIGLALARWVVERHGGEIAIDSSTGGGGLPSGTIVTIRLPAHAPRLVIGAAS